MFSWDKPKEKRRNKVSIIQETVIENILASLSKKEPIAVILCGLPGTGKTLLAERLSSRKNFQHFTTDATRKEITKGNPKYTKEESEKTYTELFQRAVTTLQKGQSTILDGTFLFRPRRREICQRLAGLGHAFTLILVITDDEKVIQARLEQKRENQALGLDNNPSDADFSVYLDLQKKVDDKNEPDFNLPSSKEGHLIVVDTQTGKVSVKGGQIGS